jgi:hypothetical protein
MLFFNKAKTIAMFLEDFETADDLIRLFLLVCKWYCEKRERGVSVFVQYKAGFIYCHVLDGSVEDREFGMQLNPLEIL